jgi:hypothetical protein
MLKSISFNLDKALIFNRLKHRIAFLKQKLILRKITILMKS